MDTAWLHIGRCDDFLGGNTLLIEGDREGIRELAAALRPLADGASSRIDFNHHPGVTIHGATMVVEVSHVDVGAREIERGRIVWQRSREAWADVAAQVAALLDA